MALVGITGLKKILVASYQRVAGGQFGSKMKAFDTEEEAKEFLAG